jgi:hypothetical protein
MDTRTVKTQYRYFAVTIQASNRIFAPAFLPTGVDYICGQLELGSNLHWQLLVYSKVKRTLVGLAKFFPGHIEGCRDKDQLFEYCRKIDDTTISDTWFELGKKPFNSGSSVDWDVVRQQAMEGKFLDIPASVFTRYTNNILRINSLFGPKPPVRKDIECFWYYGKAGSGKSTRAVAEAEASGGEVYIKEGSHWWWDGYRGEKNVIIDECGEKITCDLLKRWCDWVPCQVKIHGGMIPLCATKFWITSNYTLEEMQIKWNCNDESIRAIKRRFKFIKFSTFDIEGFYQ